MSTSLSPYLVRAGHQAVRTGLAWANRLDRAAPRSTSAPVARHPMQPAAVRVERSRSRSGADRRSQTAVTMWFGEGPALPGPDGHPVFRSAVRVGVGVLAAAAVAALGSVAAQREAQLASARPSRLEGGKGAAPRVAGPPTR